MLSTGLVLRPVWRVVVAAGMSCRHARVNRGVVVARVSGVVTPTGASAVREAIREMGRAAVALLDYRSAVVAVEPDELLPDSPAIAVCVNEEIAAWLADKVLPRAMKGSTVRVFTDTARAASWAARQRRLRDLEALATR